MLSASTGGGSAKYRCRICGKEVEGRPGLVKHLTGGHQHLEVCSYVADIMIAEQGRDGAANRLWGEYDRLRREMSGED